jgi:hypothetical protein
VIRLANLTPEELYVLLNKLRLVHSNGDPDAAVLPEEALPAFMEHCQSRIGARYFQTPRNTIKAFVQLLSILEQNPEASWRELLGAVDIADDQNPDLEPLEEEEPNPDSADADLTTFRL